MNIEFVGRNYEMDEQVRTFAQSKLRKVDKFLDEPIEVRVTCETEKHRYIADLHVAHRYGVLQATEETGDMYDALNLAVDKIEKQARRSRKKYMDRRRRADRATTNGQRWAVEVLEGASLGSGAGPRIIETSQIAVKPMSIDEAALELADSLHSIVVFRDAATDRINVLYRRKDENFGLITPEL